MRRIDRFRISESASLGLIAILVGLGSGVGVWLFKGLIDLVHELFYTKATALIPLIESRGMFLLPISGGLVVGLMLHFFIGEERHHGVAGIIEAVALAGGRLRYRRMPMKAIAAAISIGSGASVGPEDPSVQIGANLGSLAGQRLCLSDERTRSLVAAGTAGAIAAAFNAPIAGVFFALEIILGDFSSSSVGMIVISAVASSTFTQAVSGAQPAFRVPAYAFHSAWELPLYLILGLLAGTIAAFYVRLLYYAHDMFARWLPQR
jgi:CIC family chloride channel protein